MTDTRRPFEKALLVGAFSHLSPSERYNQFKILRIVEIGRVRKERLNLSFRERLVAEPVISEIREKVSVSQLVVALDRTRERVNVGAKPGQWGGVKAGHLADKGAT